MRGRILLCVLDWGLGHATRSLALARELQAAQFEVAVASSGRALDLLKLEMQDARFFELPSYNIQYSAGSSFVTTIIFQLGRIATTIRLERDVIASIIEKEKFDAIISDNRYGCNHPSVRSIFLSHHLSIRLPSGWSIFSGVVNRIHRKWISTFDECWVPDFPERLLSGELSVMDARRLVFIGPLSTMHKSKVQVPKKYSILAVVSGPEPQRTVFANLLLRQLATTTKPWLLVHGLPGGNGVEGQQVAFMKREDLNTTIEQSELLITRPGYSSVMDMAAIGGKALLVPTPGQTEQIYLAERLMAQGLCFSQEQDKFDLQVALKESAGYKGFPGYEKQNELLASAMNTLI